MYLLVACHRTAMGFGSTAAGWLYCLFHLQCGDGVLVQQLCVHALAHDVGHLTLLSMDFIQTLDPAVLPISDNEVLKLPNRMGTLPLSVEGMAGLVITLWPRMASG